MVSKSIMIAVANDVGGNAVFIKAGNITIATVTLEGITIIARSPKHGEIKVVAEDISADADVPADEDDAELLGSTRLAAYGRVLARGADDQLALVMGENGWVGVRA